MHTNRRQAFQFRYAGFFGCWIRCQLRFRRRSVILIVRPLHTFMKNTTLSLLLVLLVSACSHKTESAPTAGFPEFSIAAGDVIGTSVEATTGNVSGSPTQVMYMVHVELSSAKGAEFRQFTKDHVNQQVQILVGAKVIQEPMIAAEIVSPKIDLIYSSKDEAQSVADLLSKK